jgi:uncharacterized lipoprotein YbaY
MKQVIIGAALIALMVGCKKDAVDASTPVVNDTTTITTDTVKIIDSVAIDTNKSVSTDAVTK